MIERRKWHCEWCAKEFETGRWLGCDGESGRSHVVSPKIYYSRSDALQVSIKADVDMTDLTTGVKVHIPCKVAQFTNGQYVTNDPETQEVLDRKGHLQSKDQYEKDRLTPELRAQRAETQAKEDHRAREEAERKLKELQEQMAAGSGKSAKPERPSAAA